MYATVRKKQNKTKQFCFGILRNIVVFKYCGENYDLHMQAIYMSQGGLK